MGRRGRTDQTSPDNDTQRLGQRAAMITDRLVEFADRDFPGLPVMSDIDGGDGAIGLPRQLCIAFRASRMARSYGK